MVEAEEDSNDEHSPQENEASPQEVNAKKKKKRNRRRKKKKKQPRQVHFGGTISVREHERCLGTDGVPADGGWPLGIANSVTKEYHVDLENFEERRQQELQSRWSQILASNASDEEQPPPGCLLETRQFDYAKKENPVTKSTKNPLFGPLSEDERMRLLVSNDASNEHEILKSPPRNKHKPTRARRSRSNSHCGSENSSSSPTMTTRSRSNSEQFYSQSYPSTDVLHVRNELEQVRVHRSMEESTGCACRKLDVYLPPPNCGKKAQHRRMSAQKVKEHLRKRGKLPAGQSTRAELEQLLHDVVEQEPCCWGEDCLCVRNGIGCQADACSCWFDSHQRKGHNNNSTEKSAPSVETIRSRCGNNMYAVDLDAIHDFRCQVINADNN